MFPAVAVGRTSRRMRRLARMKRTPTSRWTWTRCWQTPMQPPLRCRASGLLAQCSAVPRPTACLCGLPYILKVCKASVMLLMQFLAHDASLGILGFENMCDDATLCCRRNIRPRPSAQDAAHWRRPHTRQHTRRTGRLPNPPRAGGCWTRCTACRPGAWPRCCLRPAQLWRWCPLTPPAPQREPAPEPRVAAAPTAEQLALGGEEAQGGGAAAGSWTRSWPKWTAIRRG